MRVLFLTSGKDVPASRFRFQQYVPYLRKLGITATVSPSRPCKYTTLPYIGFQASMALRRILRLVDLLRSPFYDVVVLERELLSIPSTSLERMFRRTSRRLILDLDDAIYLLSRSKFEEIVRLSDTVVVGNRYLREAVAPLNPNVCVIPTVVDCQRYVIRPQRETGDQHRVVIGWTGSSSTLPYLLEFAGVFQALSQKCDFELRVISDAPVPVRIEGVDVRSVRWRKESEIEDLHAFDIGVMPLPDNEWTRGKCALKVIQYMALGIPAVSSPVGVTPDIVVHEENGFLAQSQQEWVDLLLRLVNAPALRKRIGLKARSRVEKGYSVQAMLLRLAEVLRRSCAT